MANLHLTLTFTLLLLTPTLALAEPKLIDSIDKAQFPGIKVNAISSMTAAESGLWITDASRNVHQWAYGKPPITSTLSDKNSDQRISKIIPMPQDRFLLTDSGDEKIWVGKDGDWKSIANEGELEGEIKDPVAAAWSDQGIIYVAENGNNRISAFTEQGLFLFTFGNDATSPENNLKRITDISLDRLGRVYVLDESDGGRILVYSDVGVLDKVIGKDEFKKLIDDSPRITAIAIRPDGIMILADKKSGKIYEIDWENMELLSSFGTVGKGRGQFQRVSSISLDHAGKLYVADQGNEKIEVFQLDGQQAPWMQQDADKLSIRLSSVLRSACQVSYIYAAEQVLCLNQNDDTVTLRSHDGAVLQTLNAKFNDPIRAVFDQEEILVLDDNDVKVFDAAGQYKFTFGGNGRRDGEFLEAKDLDITPSAVYIADTGNKRVQVFSRNGLFLRVFGDATLQDPQSISVDQRSNIYVADSVLKRVIAFSPSGDILSILGFPQEHPHEFLKIYDVMTDQDNILYFVTKTPNNPLSVWLYKDNKFMYRFSPKAQEPAAGFDALWSGAFRSNPDGSLADLFKAATLAQQSVTEISIDMTQEPMKKLFASEAGFFSDEQWMFNSITNNPTAFSLVDLTNHARYTFDILRAPKQVRNVLISGNETDVRLDWLAESKSFSGYYNVYGRSDISQPFTLLKQTVLPQVNLGRKDGNITEYRVSAVSPLGKESEKSSVYQDYFLLGLKAYQNKDWQEAKAQMVQATALNPEHALAQLYLGKTWMALQAYDEAIQTFQPLTQTEGFKSEAIHYQADAMMQKQAWLDVKSLVDLAEKEQLVDASLYSLAAQALIQLDDIPSAIYYLSQAVALEPSSALWHLSLADANFELGATEAAIAELLNATQLSGSDAQSWLAVARAYKKHNMLDDAASAYEGALKIEPSHPEALPELALLYLEQNNLAASRSIATQMASVESLKPKSYFILGRVALAESNAPLALAMLAKAGQDEPNDPAIWIAMADAYLAINKPDREVEYLNKAVALDATDFAVHMRLGNACTLAQDNTCARDHFEQAALINDKDAQAQVALATALMQTGELNEADIHAARALQLAPKSIPAHIVLADIQNQRGMIPDSINTLKKAMLIDETNMDVHLSLTHAYMANHMYNEAMEITDKAMLLDVRNAAPVLLAGSIYLARQSFDEAITAFQKAVELAPDNAKYRQQLNMAYLQKKRLVDAGGSLLGPKLKQLQFSRVFSAAYKQYTDKPVGKLTLSNEAAVDYTNIKISLLVKEYMDFPTTMVVERIPANGEIDIDLLAAFNNRILDIDEDTGVQTEVRAEYYLAGKPHTETLNESMTIYGKNAIVWDQLDMVGSFATPKDDALAVFIRQLVNAYNPKKGAINERISKAMTVYNGLSAYGIQYLVDPNTPYGKLGATQLDTIQFPRETLRQRSGDCDDLSILLAAALANLGIETAILDVPEHLLMMFNTGVPEAQQDSISLHDEALAIIDGEVWIPLEATLIATSFTEAWAEGARKYHNFGKQDKLKIMPLATAWETYPPVTLPPAEFSLTIPSAAQLGDKINKEWGILSVKALERQVHPYRLMLSLDPSNIQAQMQIAVVYARNGLFEQAIAELEDIRSKDANNVAALNNLGNIHFLRGDFAKAQSMYTQALNIDTRNVDIMVNIAIVQYKLGDVMAAKLLFAQASKTDEQVPERYGSLALLLSQ